MAAEFEEQAGKAGVSAELHSVLVPEALAALNAGDRREHDALIAKAASGLAQCDAVMLAQFSMAPAVATLRHLSSTPVLTSPGSAVAALKKRIG